MTASRDLLRELPSVDRLLGEPEVLRLLEEYPRPAVVEATRGALASLRASLLAEQKLAPNWKSDLVASCSDLLRQQFGASLRRVINATGVVLHTNLGRAPLGADAAAAIAEVAGAYVNLEYDLQTGRRGKRSVHTEELLRRLSGAEAAGVTNNNAAAVLLIIDTLARGREVIVSRSELIEIGGSFRIPEVLERGGATLVEVGTTNKTYLRDYENAITERTGLLLKTHPSNYRIHGFTAEVSAADLAELGRARGLATCMDLGSGVLVDIQRWGLPAEPTVAACVASGLDLVCFSADKLLGGPQAGIIAGRADMVRRCARNPLMRALRCDKLVLAALQATLRVYLYPDRLPGSIPILDMLARPLDEIERQAAALGHRLGEVLGDRAQVAVEASQSLSGGGALPEAAIPTWVVVVTPAHGGEEKWASRLRLGSPPVIARTEEGRLLLDPRTLLPADGELLVAAFREIAHGDDD